LSPDQRRATIVEAAVHVFEGRDPAAVTFEEIAAEAGVSRALVYNYFGDRGGLMAAVYEQLLSELDEEIGRALVGPQPARQRLHDAVERYVSFARAHARGWQTLAMLAATRHPEVQRARKERYARLGQVWGDSAEAHVVVTGLMGLLEAVTLDWLSDPSMEASRLVELADGMAWSGLEHLVVEGVIAPGQPHPAAAELVVDLAGGAVEAPAEPAVAAAAPATATATATAATAGAVASATPGRRGR
jgi:AcrR family transcriptional regulator